jgi:hypothetical protein
VDLPALGNVPAMPTTSHITRTIATALVAGAAFAPAAAAQEQDLRSPDTKDAATRLEHTQDFRAPDTRDAAEGRTAPVVEFVEVSRDSGFDVTDAVVGAASGVGLVLIATGGALTTARLRRRRLRSALV